MNKRYSLNFGALICLVAAVYCMYCILLQDDVLPFSIGAVVNSMNHWAKHWRILVVGLLPIYVALMFFGTAIIGLYIGSNLQRWLTRFLHQK